MNKRGLHPFIYGVLRSKREESFSWLLYLVKERGLIDMPRAHGWTVLYSHQATFHDKYVELLLEYGTSSNKKSKLGRCPLHLVSCAFSSSRRVVEMNGDSHISRVLQTKGVAASEPDQDRRNKQRLVCLIAHGADATALDSHGNLLFFLVAATTGIPETFLMIHAAMQGFFESHFFLGQLQHFGKRKLARTGAQDARKRS
eukprot:scaffold522_cov168-Amphora_coffeaeformis.AAC.9